MILLIKAVHLFFQVYTLMLLVYITASWFPQLYQYRFMQFIFYCTEPYLKIFRRLIPPLGMIDFSPVIAFICLGFIQNLVISLLLKWT